MLTISPAQAEGVAQGRTQALVPRIDRWLERELPDWPRLHPEARRAELQEMIRIGRAAGFDAETDYALFARLCAAMGARWRGFVAGGEAHDVLASPQWKPEAKLLRLDELAKGTERRA